MNTIELETRVAELEDELKQRDEKISQLRQEMSEAQDLASKARDHVESVNETLEQWIYAFEMEQNEAGLWVFAPNNARLLDAYKELSEEHDKLVRDFNRLVAKYNRAVAPAPHGRPLGATEAQMKDVLKRHKDGGSIRAIASATSLTPRTVRTIIEKHKGTDRTSKRANLLRKREFDRLRAADYRARKRARDQLPKQIAETQKRGEEFIQAAKGIGGR